MFFALNWTQTKNCEIIGCYWIVCWFAAKFPHFQSAQSVRFHRFDRLFLLLPRHSRNFECRKWIWMNRSFCTHTQAAIIRQRITYFRIVHIARGHLRAAWEFPIWIDNLISKCLVLKGTTSGRRHKASAVYHTQMIAKHLFVVHRRSDRNVPKYENSTPAPSQSSHVCGASCAASNANKMHALCSISI